MMKELRAEINARFDTMDARLRAVEHGMAKLEGLREAIAVRGGQWLRRHGSRRRGEMDGTRLVLMVVV